MHKKRSGVTSPWVISCLALVLVVFGAAVDRSFLRSSIDASGPSSAASFAALLLMRQVLPQPCILSLALPLSFPHPVHLSPSSSVNEFPGLMTPDTYKTLDKTAKVVARVVDSAEKYLGPVSDWSEDFTA